MTERMSDERLAEIDGYVAALIEDEILDVEDALAELLQALKTERKYAERTCEWESLNFKGAPYSHLAGCNREAGRVFKLGEYCPYCGGKIVEKDND